MTHHKPTTWVLVADSARARLFASDHQQLEELQDFVNADARHPARTSTSHDQRPRTQESIGSARHVIEPHTSPEEKISAKFAREISEALERGRTDWRYDRLILAAPPRFMGVLQHALSKHVRSLVTAQLCKDLTKLGSKDIQQHLAADGIH
jgi:protein required for attachment to host cells